MTKSIHAPDVSEHADASDDGDARERSMTPSGVHARTRRSSEVDRPAMREPSSAPRGALADERAQRPNESARSGTHRVGERREDDEIVQAAALSAFSPASAGPAANDAAADGGEQLAPQPGETLRVSLTPAHLKAMLDEELASDEPIAGSETVRVSLTPAHAEAMPASFIPAAGAGGETVRVVLTPSRVEALLRDSAADGGAAPRPGQAGRALAPGGDRGSSRTPIAPGRSPRPPVAANGGRNHSAGAKTANRNPTARSGQTAIGIGPAAPRATTSARSVPARSIAARSPALPPAPPLSGSFGTHPEIDFATSLSFSRSAASVKKAVHGIAGHLQRDALVQRARALHARLRRWLKLPELPPARPRSVEELRAYKARMRAALAAHVRANAARAAALARVNASDRADTPAPIARPARAHTIAPPASPAAQAYAAAVSNEVRASMRAAGSPADDPHWLAALAPLIQGSHTSSTPMRAAHADASSPPSPEAAAADGGHELEPSELGPGGREDGTTRGGGGEGERRMSLFHAALIALLAAGATDVLVLNLWAVPKALQETTISAARKTQPRSAPANSPSTMPAPRAAVTPPPSPIAPPTAPPPMAAAPEHFGYVLFRYGDFWVGPKSQATLLELLPRMAADPRAIHLIGHADAHGTPSVNRRISEARAHAVARILIDNGIAEDRVRISGVGSDGRDETALARRVELELEDMP